MSCYKNLFEAIVQQSGSSGEPVFTPHGIDKQPVYCLPGSARKINVLARRLDEGLELWHPDDRHCLNDATHRQMMRDLLGLIYDEADDAIWVNIAGRIVMANDMYVTIRKKRADGKGHNQMRIRVGSIYGYKYQHGFDEEPLTGPILTGLKIPRWLAVSRNLEAM